MRGLVFGGTRPCLRSSEFDALKTLETHDLSRYAASHEFETTRPRVDCGCAERCCDHSASKPYKRTTGVVVPLSVVFWCFAVHFRSTLSIERCRLFLSERPTATHQAPSSTKRKAYPISTAWYACSTDSCLLRFRAPDGSFGLSDEFDIVRSRRSGYTTAANSRCRCT